MIETDQQRRWWFATHPEYSHRSSGRRGTEDDNSDKLDPEKVDAWAEERLKHEKDPVAIELLKQAKFWFGTEFASKPPGQQYALLGEEKPVGSDALFTDKSEDVPSKAPQATTEDQAKQEFMSKMMGAGWSREWAESKWREHKQNETVAENTAWAVEVAGIIGIARAVLSGASRWMKSVEKLALPRKKLPNQEFFGRQPRNSLQSKMF